MNGAKSSTPYVHHVIELPPSSPGLPSAKISCLFHPSMIPLLPTPNAAPIDPDPPFEIHDTPHKGFGMFAKRPIPKGSLIIVEHPTYVLPGYATGNISFEEYEEVGRRIPEEEYKKVAKMANCRTREECPSIIDGVARTNALTLHFRFPSDFPDDGDDGRTARHYGGLFLNIGRCNHSCGPNAAWKWNFDTLSSTLFALRDIAVGEEISHTYANPLQSREKRWKKLRPDYLFDCDCPWCTLTDTAAQARSDLDREYIGVYTSTHPTYSKWAIDLCLPDDYVIQSHFVALPIISREGLHRLLPMFLEEIVRCYIELGDEAEFRKWALETIDLCRIGNRELAQEFQHILENPQKNSPKWGRRIKMREEAQRSRLEEFNMEEDGSFNNLFAATSAFVAGLFTAVTNRPHPPIVAGLVALNSGANAATFFALREFAVGPALTYLAPWPQYARRREELGIARPILELGSEGAGEAGQLESRPAPSLESLKTNKLLDSGISGAVTGGLVRGCRSGKRAILPGAAMAGVACLALQYGYNRFSVMRLRSLAQPAPEEPPQPEVSFRERVIKTFGLSEVSDDEYLLKLKKQRDAYQKRIDDLTRLAEYEEAQRQARAPSDGEKDQQK